MKKNIPDNFIDLTITSPPYDNLRTYKGFIFDYKSMLKELYRVTKDGGVLVWITGDATINGSETLTSFRHALYAKKIGFNVHDTMIYHKTNPMPTHKKQKRYTQAFEYMFVFVKGKPRVFNPITEKCKYSGKNASVGSIRKKDGSLEKKDNDKLVRERKIISNIWGYNVGYMKSTKDKITYKHPAIFPEVLAQDHIISWSNEGDVVLDPMCGCYDKKTQILTNNGWKFFSQLNNYDLVATVDNRRIKV